MVARAGRGDDFPDRKICAIGDRVDDFWNTGGTEGNQGCRGRTATMRPCPNGGYSVAASRARIRQENHPDRWLIECEQKTRLPVAVAVEHRPKYQHKRFLSWGVRAWAKPV